MSDRMLGNIGTASESKRVTAHGIINRIEANASVGNVSVTVPAGSEYEVDDAGNLEEYDFEEGDIDKVLEDLGVDDVDKLLEKYDFETDAFDKLPKKFEPINAKEGKTVLATREIPYVSHVLSDSEASET